jgi:hypothetical protein
MSREAMQQALAALKLIDEAMPFPVAKHAITALHQALEKPADEPVAICPNCLGTKRPHKDDPEWKGRCDCIPPQPPQRKPLTDEQIATIVDEMNGNEPPALFWKDLTRAIEAAHGITGEQA